MASPHDQPSVVTPGHFEPSDHYYPRVLNAVLHPLVRFFLSLGNERIAERYCHMHPEAKSDAVHAALAHCPRFFRWGGADLFHTTTASGHRRIVVIETNSSPSGQKSMPFLDEAKEQGGYRVLLEHAFLPLLKKAKVPGGGLAVLFDKNEMEASAYGAVLSDLTGEPVYLVPFHTADPSPNARFTDDGVLEIRLGDDKDWMPIRAAYRYVTQKPWDRIPPLTKTIIFNPVIVCLAGGRNKMLAAKAYDLYRSKLKGTGLTIHTPDTIWDVTREQVPMWVDRMGGFAVVKVPYSNAGQGVYTITSKAELDAFMALTHPYERFIVQALVGNAGWSSEGSNGRFYHVGTIPDRRSQIFVADLRFMVGAGPTGFIPIAVYARRARMPLTQSLGAGAESWGMLGTNLSVKTDSGWITESERLLIMDSRDFNKVGIGLDDLIEGYVQTVLSVTAIDEMAKTLTTQKRRFRARFFRSINPDPALERELYLPQPEGKVTTVSS